MFYYVTPEGTVRKITKVTYLSNTTGLPVAISFIKDLSPEDVVRVLFTVINDLPSIGYWLNDKPWSNLVPWRNFPE